MPKPADGVLSDEAAHLCQKALYVEPLNCPIGVIEYATNGHEHIHLARKETQELFPDSDFSQCMPMFQMMKIGATTSVAETAEKPIALEQWKNNQAYCFSRLSLQLKSERKQLMKKFPQKQFPPVGNEEEVCLFCLGSEFCEKIFKNGNVHDVDGHVPLLSIVLHLSQEEIFTVLRYMSQWANQIEMNDVICEWIYSLLACLHKPVSDVCEKFLEDFHDECVKKIKNCDEDEKYQLHLITGILMKYFCIKTYQVGPSLDNFSKLY